MLERIERDAARPLGGVVAELVGDETVRRLVKGYRKDDGQNPRARLIDHCGHAARRVHCSATFEMRAPARSASNRASASPRSKPFAAEARRIASPRRSRA